jgi:hypothetical protein
MKKIAFVAFLFMWMDLVVSFAQIPRQITYQGYLDSLNNPYTGNRMMRFKIYDDATGGNNLWTEDHASVAIFDGFFQVQLGSITPLNLDFDIPYWLGISIENEPELVPRTALTSTPYSFNIKDGSVTTTKLQDNAVTLPKIAPDVMVKVYEGWAPGATSYTIGGLNGNLHKIYKIYFQGRISGNQDVLLVIRPNNDTGVNYKTWMRGDGDASGWSGPWNNGIFMGRSHWNHQVDISSELTLFCESTASGFIRFAHGHASIWDTNQSPLAGFVMFYYYGKWNNTTDNITSITIQALDPSGNPSQYTFSGRFIVYALVAE